MNHEKILIPIAPELEFEDRQIQFIADSLPKAASLTLVSVIEDFNTIRGQLKQHSGSSIELLDQAKALQKERLSHIRERILAYNPQAHCELAVLAGIAFIKIIEFAHQQAFDLIAVMARPSAPVSAWFGSTTRHLMRKSTRPVLTLTPKTNPIKKILIAVDAVVETASAQALNDHIIAQGLAWARRHQAQVSVCHAWQLEGEGYLKHWGRKDALDIALLAEKERELREKALHELIDRHASTDQVVHPLLVEGRAQDVIPPLLERQEIDLLVMGTVCRTGIPGFIIGNTAESMINQVHCAVLALKPEDFISPVEVANAH